MSSHGMRIACELSGSIVLSAKSAEAALSLPVKSVTGFRRYSELDYLHTTKRSTLFKGEGIL